MRADLCREGLNCLARLAVVSGNASAYGANMSWTGCVGSYFLNGVRTDTPATKASLVAF